MGSSNTFSLNTKGYCLFCLSKSRASPPNPNPEGEEDGDEDEAMDSFSFRSISHYLGVNLKNVFTEVKAVKDPGSLSLLEKSELRGLLCAECGRELETLSKIRNDLEVLQMLLDGCVRRIHVKLEGAERSEGLKEEFTRDMLSSPQTLLHYGIVERFRKETMKRASSMIGKAMPQVRLERLDAFQEGSDCPNKTAKLEVNQESLTVDVLLVAPLHPQQSQLPIITPVDKANAAVTKSSSSSMKTSASSERNAATATNEDDTGRGTAGQLPVPVPVQIGMGIDDILAEIGIIDTTPSVTLRTERYEAVQFTNPSNLSRHIRKFHQHEGSGLQVADAAKAGPSSSDKTASSSNHSSKAPPSVESQPFPKKFECDVCHKKYRRHFELSDHKKVVHLGIKFRSGLCPAVFGWKASRNSHRRRVHPDARHIPLATSAVPSSSSEVQKRDTAPTSSTATSKKKYACDICHKGFISASKRTIHHRSVHLGVKFSCQFCSARFKYADNRARHVRNTHKGGGNVSKVAAPNFAIQNSTQEENLPGKSNPATSRHVPDHPCQATANATENAGRDTPGDTYPLPLQIVLEEGTEEDGLRAFPSEKKQYQCDICPKNFNSTSMRSVHRRVTHFGIKFRCSFCPAQFTHPSNRRKHVNALHKEPVEASKTKLSIRGNTASANTTGVVGKPMPRLLPIPIPIPLGSRQKFKQKRKNLKKVTTNETALASTSTNSSHNNITEQEAALRTLPPIFPIPVRIPKVGATGVPKTATLSQKSSKMFQCKACRESFMTSSQRSLHWKAVHLGLRNRCHQCPAEFSNKSNMLEHVRGVHGDGEAGAIQKGVKKAVSGPGEKVKKAVSGESVKKAVSGESVKKAVCGESVKRAKSGKSVKKAVSASAVAVSKPTQLAPVQNSSTSSKTIRKKSADNDTETRMKWKCDLCPAEFLQRNNMNRHKRLAHNTKRIESSEGAECLPESMPEDVPEPSHLEKVDIVRFNQCPHCDMAYDTPSSLKLHVEMTHVLSSSVEKKHECKMCGKSYSRSDTLAAHWRSVHLGQRYKCDWCSTLFTLPGSLRMHKKLNCPKRFDKVANQNQPKPAIG